MHHYDTKPTSELHTILDDLESLMDDGCTDADVEVEIKYIQDILIQRNG